MSAWRPTAAFGVCFGLLMACVFVAAAPARAQQPQSLSPARIIVTGEGTVRTPPDYAEVTGGVTIRAKTAKEAAQANAKLMAAVNAALLGAGVAQQDIQTSQFSVQPVYAPREPNTEPKLTGFSVSNQLSVRVRPIDKVGEVLDRLIAAGATDVGNVQFLHSDLSKKLDQARQAAMADALRKAALYAQASGLSLGGVAWITDQPAFEPAPLFGARRQLAAAPPTPIAVGEDTLGVQITVGFDIAH